MISPWVAGAAATLAFASLLIAARRFGDARRVSRSIQRLGTHSPKVERKRVSILEGPAEMVARTPLGKRLFGYAKQVHPQVSPSDVIAWTLSGLVAGLMIGVLLFPGSPLVVVPVLTGPFVIDRVGRARGARTRRLLEEELPEALNIQASALRAGHSTARSLNILATELEGPLGRALKVLVQGLEMGEPLDTVLPAMSGRLMSRDVDLWVTAMLVHRVTGGNLTVVLDSLSERIRQRQQLKAEVRALTAQGRMSGVVVAGAPAVFFVLLSITSREEMDVLFTTPIGMSLLVVGLTMQALGFLWIRRILKVKL